MVKAGLGEHVVIAAIRRNEESFDLSALQLVQLKQSGVSDNILQVMLDPEAVITPASQADAAPQQSRSTQPPQYGVRPTTATGVAPILPAMHSNPSGATPEPGAGSSSPIDVHDPEAPHDSGVYLYTVKNRAQRMILIERAAYQGGKTGGMFTAYMTAGLKKVKWKAIVSGRSAPVRTTDRKPVFYFYFEDKAAGLGKSAFGLQSVSNPNQFALVKLKVTSRNRETIVGAMGAFGGSSGTHEKSMHPFRSERLRPGVYRVTPAERLEPGEYCFLASGMGGSGMMGAAGAGAATAADIFDFSIIPAE